MEKGNRRVQYLITFCVSLSTLTLGVISSWPTLVIFKFSNNETDIHMNNDEKSWMLSMTAPGFLVGSWVTWLVSENLGRRATFLGSALSTALGAIIILNAKKAWLIYLTRFLWGCGTGMTSTVITMYLAEVVDKEVRGTLSICTRVATNLGSLVIMVIGPFMSYHALNSLLLVLPICYFLACLWIPESPYYYLKEGKVIEAKKELKRLGKYDNEMALQEALMTMQADIKKEIRYSSSLKELFTGKRYRKALIIAFGLKMTQIMSGTVTIQQYISDIITDSNAQIQFSTISIISGTANFIVGIMSSILVDRVGRRPLLLYSYLIIGKIFVTVGIYFFLKEVMFVDKDKLSSYAIIILFGIIMSNIVSTLGYNSVVGVVSAEIFPMNVKAIALTSLSISGGLFGFMVSRGYQVIKDLSGLFGVFSICASVALCGALLVYFMVPETRNKSLREIQVMLSGGVEDDDKDAMNGDTFDGECKEMTELKPKESQSV